MLGTLLLSSPWGYAQTTAQPAAAAPAQDEDVLVLSPFEVSAEDENGYATATTLAGNRLNTELRDLGNAISVVNSQFMKDIAATNNETLLQYTVGTEVGNLRGNFAGTGDSAFLDESQRFTNPNQNTRVRGLAAADNTRDYFLSDIPWDGYNVDRVDLQRGPNSILFGQGSPAGIINVGLRAASFRNANEVTFLLDSYGTTRATVDLNYVVKKDELAIRVMALHENEKFQQEEAFEDDDRFLGSIRWEPKFLRKGSARTIFKANYEEGDIESNRPRSLPPIDKITPWFQTGTYAGTWRSDGTYRDANGVVQNVVAGTPRIYNNLNRETFNPHQLQDDNTGRTNHGQNRPGINGGADSGRFNPAYNPWVGNFAQQFAGANAFYGTPDSAPPLWLWEARTNRGIGADGNDDNGVGSYAFHRPGGIADYAEFARNAGLPFSGFGVYKNYNLTDSSVFDFYNHLLDGPNKSEWSGWKAYDITVAQTFMDDKFGFQATLNKQEYDNGQTALLDGNRQAIYIDFMSVYSDGTPTGINGEPHVDGTPNPNVGRAFVSDSGQGGNRSYSSDMQDMRITGFFNHDFSKNHKDNKFLRFLGAHTFTGLYDEFEQNTDRRSWARYTTLDGAYANMFEAAGNAKFNNNEFSINRVVYLGGTLKNSTSASGAYLPSAGQLADITSSTMKFFDSTWKATGVDPAAPWENNYFAPGDARRASTQSENMANYVGWVNTPLSVLDSEKGNRDRLTTDARLNRNKLESKAFVWQAKFWDNALIGTFGYRKDTPFASERRTTSENTTNAQLGYLDLSSANLSMNSSAYHSLRPTGFDPNNWSVVVPNGLGTYSELQRETVTSKAYSLVAHLDQLPFLGKLTQKLPFALSVFYNDSTNFQPAANRRNIYGEAIPLPMGATKDQGILIESRNGKFALKLNKYKTEITNATSSALNGAWFIGRSQAWSAQWVNIFQYNLSGDTGDTANGPSPGRYTYGTAPGETQAQADAREAAAIGAWRTWQASVDPRFYSAWQLDVTGAGLTRSVGSTDPAGFSITEDSVSEGYEIEFTAQPTKNWRVTLNATQTEARRFNIGGTELAEFVAAYETALKTTPVGDLRIWWGGAGNETALFQWNNNIGSEWAARKLQEGTNVPELREWRINAITNYDFSEGRLKGLSVGGAIRWQDDVVIGYKPVPVPNDPTSISFDIANPYKGPAETSIDLWIGYGMKLGSKVDWRIQLNATNVGKGNDLIAITTQPDGTPAGYRIAPSQYFTLTNTFRF